MKVHIYGTHIVWCGQSRERAASKIYSQLWFRITQISKTWGFKTPIPPHGLGEMGGGDPAWGILNRGGTLRPIHTSRITMGKAGCIQGKYGNK